MLTTARRFFLPKLDQSYHNSDIFAICLPALNSGRHLYSVGRPSCGTCVPHLVIIIIITPHHSTTYVDAAYCYRPSSMVCRSVCHTSEPCKNGCTDRDVVWVEDSSGPKEPCWGLLDGVQIPMGRDNFEGVKGRPIIKYRDTLRSPVRIRLNRSRCRLGCVLGWAVGIMSCPAVLRDDATTTNIL